MTEPRERRTHALHIPQAGSVTFADEVCGLPSSKSGCVRWADYNKDPASVSPCRQDKTAQRWLLVLADASAEVPTVRHELLDKRPGVVPPRHHYLLFALGADSRASTPIPLYMEFGAWDDAAADWFAIDRWLGEDGRGSLAATFGTSIFGPLRLGEESHVSPADLIETYLDVHCQYRNASLGAAFGRCWCRADRWLQDMQILGRISGRLSYIDPVPEYPAIRPIPYDWFRIGGLDRHGRLNQGPQPELLFARTAPEDARVTFADCFVNVGRRHVLPTEATRAFLCFSMGEVATFLLYWLLQRCLAAGGESGKQFCARLDDALAPNAGGETLDALLDAQVRPLPDESICRALHAPRLLHYSEPVAFRVLLRQLDLDPEAGADAELILRLVCRFLTENFTTQGHDGGRTDSLARLPMYHGLHWSADAQRLHESKEVLAGAARELSSLERHARLRAVLQTLLQDRPTDSRAELARLSPRSVLPMGEVLEHWPRNVGVTHYWVFPLWDDLVDGVLRPVVFANVFGRLADGRPVSIDALVDEGRLVHQAMQELGVSFVHNYYQELTARNRAMEGQLREGAFLAHELNAMFGKRFSNLHARFDALGDGAKELRQAWAIVRANVEFMWIKMKLAAFPTAPQRAEAMRRFLEPLASMNDAEVIVAITQVAQHVYATQVEGRAGPTIPALAVKAASELPMGALYSRCHLVVAEMIDNFCRYAPHHTVGEWSAAVTTGVLTVQLHQAWPETNLLKPESFTALAEFLRSDALGDAGVAWTDDSRTAVNWWIRLNLRHGARQVGA